MEQQISKMLADGIIRPSRSAWNSPLWVVQKKGNSECSDGEKKLRLVIDYRRLNQKTISEKYPISDIQNILDQLGGNKYFTTLDLASSFHQIKVNDLDIEKTAFSVNSGKYEFLRMPFGLKNAPAIFQRAIDDVFREHIGKICYVYIDDLVVFGRNLTEHIHNLKVILSTLEEANLKIQLQKSKFLCQSVEYLGYIITLDGIRPNQAKILTIKNWPKPTNTKELRSFLGMVGYYRRFIKGYADLTKPLSNHLRGKNNSDSSPIELTSEELKCFESMKQVISGNDILTYSDFDKPFLITTDASNYAIGAVLSQGEGGKWGRINQYILPRERLTKEKKIFQRLKKRC